MFFSSFLHYMVFYLFLSLAIDQEKVFYPLWDMWISVTGVVMEDISSLYFRIQMLEH